MPPHQPTKQSRNFVRAMASQGYTHVRICEVLELRSVNTLKKYYRDEIKETEAKLHVAIAQSIAMQALGGPEQDWRKANITAAIWFSKTRMGWHEPKSDAEADAAKDKTIVVFGGFQKPTKPEK